MGELGGASASYSLSDIHIVFVDTNLDTRLALPVHVNENISGFKDKLCQQHKHYFSEHGNIKISALKVKRRRHFFQLPDTMTMVNIFDHAKRREWFLSADAVKEEKDNPIVEIGPEIKVDKRKKRKRRYRDLDAKKSHKKSSKDLNQSVLPVANTYKKESKKDHIVQPVSVQELKASDQIEKLTTENVDNEDQNITLCAHEVVKVDANADTSLKSRKKKKKTKNNELDANAATTSVKLAKKKKKRKAKDTLVASAEPNIDRNFGTKESENYQKILDSPGSRKDVLKVRDHIENLTSENTDDQYESITSCAHEVAKVDANATTSVKLAKKKGMIKAKTPAKDANAAASGNQSERAEGANRYMLRSLSKLKKPTRIDSSYSITI